MPQATMWSAFVRGLASAALAFAGSAYAAFLSLDSVAGVPDGEVYKGAILAGIGGALAAFGWRAGGEGGYDAWRQKQGGVTPADVQPPPPESPPVP